MSMFVYPGSGTYFISYLAIELDAAGNICFEKIVGDTITVECETCCADFDLFCQNVENAISTSVNNDSCKVKVNFGNLPDCDYIEYIDWGVNPAQQTQGPFNAGDMSMFVYPGSGTYFISYLAIELDAAGNICFEKIVRDTITVECNTCCTDFDLFCQNVENAVSISVDNDSCKVKVNFGNLPDCDYIEYIDWGVNPAQQTQGPFNAGDMSMFVYPGSGTYFISYQAIELDAAGNICFEKLVRDTITVVCETCCTDFDLFCQNVENAVSISVDNDSCKVKVNFGNLPDCDYIEYIDWGVNPSQQTQGPFNAGDMSMFVYPFGGTYYLSYLAIEVDDNGLICFEKLLRDTVTVVCAVGTDDQSDQDKIKLFPNPAKGEIILHLETRNPGDLNLEIQDIWGRRLITEKLTTGINNHTFSVEAFPAGIYFVKIVEDGRPIWIEK